MKHPLVAAMHVPGTYARIEDVAFVVACVFLVFIIGALTYAIKE